MSTLGVLSFTNRRYIRTGRRVRMIAEYVMVDFVDTFVTGLNFIDFASLQSYTGTDEHAVIVNQDASDAAVPGSLKVTGVGWGTFMVEGS